jgi:predicted membrane-bound spermidine synthase
MAWYFVFFFLSGFCSILYELIWLRLAVAQFGVTSAMVSIVLSVFMAGLGVGSWIAGRLTERYGSRVKFPALRFYSLAEFLIGCSAFGVPVLFGIAHRVLQSLAGASAMTSASYYLASGLLVALILIPCCACMGATIPLAMYAIRRDTRLEAGRSFSFLYLSNVVGAIAGATFPLLLIELYGFHAALYVGAALNLAIALGAFARTLGTSAADVQSAREKSAVDKQPEGAPQGRSVLILLFMTGLATMGMEMIWIRLYTAYIGPMVYSFALILASYLVATFVGSLIYRRISSSRVLSGRGAWVFLGLLGLLPLITADPRLQIFRALRVFPGIAIFCGLIGFLTPMLVDRWSGGDPLRAGKAYAVNVLGCIFGPLLAGFILLPIFGERASMLILSLPWFAVAIPWGESRRISLGWKTAGYASIAAALAVFLLTKDYETLYPQRKVLRDSTATVIATGAGMNRRLFTNGVGMTSLTPPITKMMSHFALSSLDHPPQSALVICFGMGTSFRSALSWGIPTTAVELVPSVPKLFSYYHDDADQLLASPLSHVVIDDGRRFLERSNAKFDVVVIDPPPPVTASASSLLYSEEFYALIRQRLQPGGILAQWLPGANSDYLDASIARALADSFPYVRAYRSSIDRSIGGLHFFASMSPLPEATASERVARMPLKARTDMMEWGPAANPVAQMETMLTQEVDVKQLIQLAPEAPALRDDRPVNEYCLLRKLHEHFAGKQAEKAAIEDRHHAPSLLLAKQNASPGQAPSR